MSNGEHPNTREAPTTDPVSHTKGPWRVGEMFHHGRVEILSADGWYVAQATGGIPIPEIEANARLIAAAPEMFAALNEVLGSFDVQTMEEILRKDCDPHDDDEFCVNITAKQLRAINDAILKAEGKKS